MRIRSLKRQVIVSILLAEILCASALTGAALLHEWRVRVRALDTTIKGRSDSLLGAIQDAEDPQDNVSVDPNELEIPKEDIYAVYNQGGRLLGASVFAPSALIGRGSDGVSTRRFDREPYRVLQREGVRIIDRLENGGVGLRRPVTIMYAVRSDHVWHEVLQAARFYVVVGALLIGITAASMLFLLRRILSPLQDLAAEASGISFRSLKFEAPSSALQLLELRPLAGTLAAMVSGLRQSFDQQTRFVGDAAHELKTSVAVVRSSVQLLMLRPREPKEYVSGLRTILFDNARVEELVNRMLVSARFEERAFNSDLKPAFRTDVSKVSQRTIERLKSFTEAHEVAIKSRLMASSTVQLSADELEVLISNLLVNAAQHSAAETEIVVSIFERSSSVILQVEDFGEGISKAALPHVFERFYREDSSRSRETGGAGLGLAICKSIVEAAQGTIAVESTQGVGTIVTVRLPLA